MNKYLKFLALAVLSAFSVTSRAQVTAYSENFGPGNNGSFPVNWTFSSADWLIDMDIANGGNGPDCDIPLSSIGAKMVAPNGSNGVIERSISEPFSTVGFSSLTVRWNGYRTTGAPTMSLAVSIDNITYTNVPFSDVVADDAWHALTPVALPAACEGVPTVYLRWSFLSDNSGTFMMFDDIRVSGAQSPTFYWDGANSISSVSSWWTNPNGTGFNPPDFTSNTQLFLFYPNAANVTSGTLNSSLVFGGIDSKLSVGNGTVGFNLTLNAVLTLTNGGVLDVNNSSTLTLANITMPAAANVNVNTGSTINFAQTSTVNIWNKNYTNLTISGGQDKNQAGSPVINGILNLNGANFLMGNGGAFQNLTLNGTISGSGSIRTSNSKLTIGGNGPFGNITFGVGSTTNTINQFIINRVSGSLGIANSLTVTSTFSLASGQFDLGGNNLTLNNAIVFPATSSDGNFIGSSTSSLTIIGSGAITNDLFFDQTSSSTRSMRSVVLNRSGATVNLGNALEIIGTLDPTAGTFASGSNLTLRSSASSKGRIGIIGAAGFFTGTPQVEVFHTAGATGWVNLASGGVTGQTMTNWNSSFAITCSICPSTQVGGVDFTSVYSYNETLGAGNAADPAHYIDLGAMGGLGSSIDSYSGYWVYLGDGFPNSGAITIPLTGGVNTKNSGGNFNLSLTGGVSTENGWNLIANPYPSPILVSQIITSAGGANVDNTILVYDPNTDANVPYTAAGTNSIIPMGQGFMIRALSNGVSFAPNENWKTTAISNVGVLKSAVPAYYYDDFMLDLTSASVNKQFFSQAYFAFNGTNNFDNGKDAYSLASSVDAGTPRIISISGGSEYLKNALPALNGTVSIPVKVSTGYAGVYQINPVNLNKLPAGACVTLYDIDNNITHNLKNGAYTATISANAPTHQFELRITVIPVNLTSTISDPVCKKDNTGYIKATGSVAGPWNYTWKDANHNIVRVMNNISTPDTLKSLYEGTYYVDINTVGSCNNASGTFNVNALTPAPVASFSANMTVLSTNNVPVSLTNLSTDALSYTWDFGDGNSVNTLHASHAYNSEGTYFVKLTAKNGACNDESVYSMQMDVSSGVVNVNENKFSDNSLRISRDASGVFAEFNFDEAVNADIIVTNILGQTVVTKQVTTDREKVYIQVPENETLIFVTVRSGNHSQTKKIVNQ